MALAAAVSVVWCAPPGPAPVQVELVAPGTKMPAWTFENLNAGAGGARKIDLATVFGRKPVLLYYWIAGNVRSEKIFKEIQTVTEGLGVDKIAAYGVAAPPMGSTDTSAIRTRSTALKIRVPVLYDEGFRLAQQLGVRSVPFVALIDKDGILRLTNGASLTQTVAYKLDLEAVIRRLAASGTLGTYGAMPPYDPVTEWIGKRPPEFELPSAEDGIPRRWTSLMASNKVNVLIFWSIDCSHCAKFMPRFNEWFKGHRDGLNVVSVGKILDDSMRTKTKEFTRLNGFVFPTLLDKDFQVAQEYQITGTPTVVIVRPDGTVDSVMPASETDFDRYFRAKKKELLKTS